MMQYELFETPKLTEARWRERQPNRRMRIKERIAFHRHAMLRLYRTLDEIDGIEQQLG